VNACHKVLLLLLLAGLLLEFCLLLLRLLPLLRKLGRWSPWGCLRLLPAKMLHDWPMLLLLHYHGLVLLMRLCVLDGLLLFQLLRALDRRLLLQHVLGGHLLLLVLVLRLLMLHLLVMHGLWLMLLHALTGLLLLLLLNKLLRVLHLCLLLHLPAPSRRGGGHGIHHKALHSGHHQLHMLAIGCCL
jgi:hypothetical protein